MGPGSGPQPAPGPKLNWDRDPDQSLGPKMTGTNNWDQNGPGPLPGLVPVSVPELVLEPVPEPVPVLVPRRYLAATSSKPL